MAGITISKGLRSKLPEDERDGLEDYLLAKSGGKCSLCEQSMNPAADTIEADHDIPEAEGGLNDRDNLRLVHSSCNRAKKNNPSVDMRPFLRFKAFADQKSNIIRYGDAAVFFGINPRRTYIEPRKNSTIFQFCDDSVREVATFEDGRIGADPWLYAYVDAPRCAIFNDDECQPRTIKLNQVWAIYNDLQNNPLHEPPSCRVVRDPEQGNQLLMFDGQHKTVATWMRGAPRITVKVYLKITKNETIHLVNSIQAKIKKLPLSPFELSAKMNDEWSARTEKYEEAVGADDMSEAGFVEWLPTQDRTRGKQELDAALVQSIVDSPELAMLQFVRRAGQPKTAISLITENAFKSKVLQRLLCMRPLTEKGDAGQKLRNQERQNVLHAANTIHELAFEPQGPGAALSEDEIERRRRMVYQSSLAYISTMLRSVYRQVLALDQERAMLEKQPDEVQLQQIRSSVERLVQHPVWTTSFDYSPKMKSVEDALSKNQDAKNAFEDVGLKLGYLVGADKLSSRWYE